MNFQILTEVKAVLALPVSKPTRADVFLIVSVLLISITLILLFSVLNSEKTTGFEITVDGRLYSSYSFSDLKDGDFIVVKTEYGYNKFLYENKSISCVETDCKDKLEIRAGKIKKANELLVCIPHKLTVQITGKMDIDAISY